MGDLEEVLSPGGTANNLSGPKAAKSVRVESTGVTCPRRTQAPLNIRAPSEMSPSASNWKITPL